MYSGHAIILDYHGNERQRNFYRHHWVVKSDWTISDDGETYFSIWIDRDCVIFLDRQILTNTH
jgi:hypothetical protein